MGFLSALFKPRHRPLSASLPPALFPTNVQDCTFPVNAWASSIQDLPSNEACRVRRIMQCKSRSGAHEEFLVVHVRHPSGRDAIVLADRDVSLDASAPSSTRSRDRIRLLADGTAASLTRSVPGGYAKIHTVKFPESGAPSVAHLAVLLTVVQRHGMAPGASAGVQSGWFAYCVAEVMREVFLGKGKTGKGWVRVPYAGMKVEGRDTVGALIREFTSTWEDFVRRQPRGDERKSRRQGKKGEIDSFADMLRAMYA